jgi:eukaryotic-like serine/threonine-protein kinase
MTQQQTLADRWQWMSEILADAMQLTDRDAREALVRERCGGDAEAERELLSLLAADTLFGTSLDESAIASAARATLGSDPHDSSALWHGKRLGAYEIVDTIAVGGMGAVFKAKRVDETYETLVAIKVMREDLSAKAKQNVLSRFRAERQMLATLNHPNITRLLDGGSTPDGLPYFVMEYVDGVPIDRYCENNALPIAERLAKFRDVLSAVHFAHQRLIVHRDLKPSNILVDRNGVVKLLDFGIARLLDPANEATQRDAAAQATTLLALTPAYASPEQVKSETITTASDVYSLGVVLYRLLTGVSPYKSKTTQPMELAREIVETDPAKPSTAIIEAEATVTNRGSDDTTRAPRSIDVARLKKSLRGDLDNIVLKALRKDPSQRYASAEQFSEDIQRSLNGEPVLAHADSLAYRAKKFVQRNRWSVGFASLAAIGLLAGIIATTYQAKLARDAQVRAEAERARAERLFGNVRDLSNRFVGEVFEEIEAIPGTAKAQKNVISVGLDYLKKLAAEASDNRALLLEAANGYRALSHLETRAQIPFETRKKNLIDADELIARAERIGGRDALSLRIGLHVNSTLAEIDVANNAHDAARARFARLERDAFAETADEYPTQRAKGDFLLAYGEAGPSIGLSFDRSLEILDAARKTYTRSIESARTDKERNAAQLLAATATLTRARVDGSRPQGAGVRTALATAEQGYAEFDRLLAARPNDAVVLGSASFAASIVGDLAAKAGDYARSREFLRTAKAIEERRVKDPAMLTGDINSLATRLTHTEIEILANTSPDELGKLLSEIDALLAKFPKESVEPLVAISLDAWRNGLAGEIFLRQANVRTMSLVNRRALLQRSVDAFDLCEQLIQKVPPDYLDQNRPEILTLIKTGPTRARAALRALTL